jgi:uncharacterized membrane protein YqhA
MLKVVLSLRLVMLVVAFGAGLGAALMVWLGFAKLRHSAHAAFVLETPNAKAVIVGVMGATDAFLFGVVLIIFAVAIAFGFVLELPEQLATRLPAWMRVNGIGELKRTLVEVILIYLIVDFATDIAESEGHLSWRILIMPLSILLIAGSLRLMGAHARDLNWLNPTWTATGATERPLSKIAHDNCRSRKFRHPCLAEGVRARFAA